MRHALRSLCAALVLVGPCVAGHGEALAQAPASGEASTLGGAVSDDPATPAPGVDASPTSGAGAVSRRLERERVDADNPYLFTVHKRNYSCRSATPRRSTTTATASSPRSSPTS